MIRQKAVLLDFACLYRPFDASDAGLIEFVMATNEELATGIVGLRASFRVGQRNRRNLAGTRIQ